MTGHRFPDLDTLDLAVTRLILKFNKFVICEGIKKLPERWKQITGLSGQAY